MAWTLVQSLLSTSVLNNTGGVPSVAATFATNLTAGNRIFVYVDLSIQNTGTQTDVNTPTDNQGNTYTRLVRAPMAGSVFTAVYLYSAVASTTGSLTVTVTAPTQTTGIANELGWTAQEYSGLDSSAGSGCLDVSAIATGNVGVTTIATGTTAASHAANQLGLCMVGDDGESATFTLSVANGFAKVTAASLDNDANTGIGVANKTSASGATESATWSGSSSGPKNAWVAVIKLAAAGPAFIAPRPLDVNQSVNRAAFF